MTKKLADGSFEEIDEIFVILGSNPDQKGEGIAHMASLPLVMLDKQKTDRLLAIVKKSIGPNSKYRLVRFSRPETLKIQ